MGVVGSAMGGSLVSATAWCRCIYSCFFNWSRCAASIAFIFCVGCCGAWACFGSGGGGGGVGVTSREAPATAPRSNRIRTIVVGDMPGRRLGEDAMVRDLLAIGQSLDEWFSIRCDRAKVKSVARYGTAKFWTMLAEISQSDRPPQPDT